MYFTLMCLISASFANKKYYHISLGGAASACVCVCVYIFNCNGILQLALYL